MFRTTVLQNASSVFLIAAWLWASMAVESIAVEDTNVICPVLQDRQATADYAVTYKGKEVRFCCSECVMEFEKNPEIYENVLPQLQNLSLRSQLQLFMRDHGGLVIGGLLFLILVGLRIHRMRNPIPEDNGAAVQGLLQKKISPAIPLFLLASYLGYEVFSLSCQLHDQQLEDEIHFATFYDFGYPPVPRRPDTEPRVKGSYFRGNDERSPKLFNDGNYRTATFHVSVCDADGVSIEAGDSVRNRELFVKLEIDRPPFTPDFLYDPEMMGTMFLTAECDRFLGRHSGVADAVELTEVEPMQKWEALFPIRRSCCAGDELRGTVYVCEKYFYKPQLAFLDRKRGGSRFHYGLRYDLKFEDDVLTATSDLYMGALYRTRKLPTWRVPMTQWFSHEPIPVLPSENVEDLELLGVTDHLAKREAAAH